MSNRSLLGEILIALIPCTKSNLEFSTNPRKFFDRLAREQSVKPSTIAVAISRAKKKGLIKKVEKEYQLTQKGKFQIIGVAKNDNQKWDGKWRLIFFDIPEEERYKREVFRKKLKELGFKQHQLSAWICPFDFSEEIDLIVDELEIEDFVKYLIGESILGGKELKKRFNLL